MSSHRVRTRKEYKLEGEVVLKSLRGHGHKSHKPHPTKPSQVPPVIVAPLSTPGFPFQLSAHFDDVRERMYKKHGVGNKAPCSESEFLAAQKRVDEMRKKTRSEKEKKKKKSHKEKTPAKKKERKLVDE